MRGARRFVTDLSAAHDLDEASLLEFEAPLAKEVRSPTCSLPRTRSGSCGRDV